VTKASFLRLSGVVGAAFCVQCFVAGLAIAQDSAVSGPNGKLDLGIGADNDAGGVFRFGGSLSLPLGDAFGFQGDLSVQNYYGTLTTSGALHLFTRDPSSYLMGVTAGVVRSEAATLGAVGAEAELYLDRLSIEAWAGVAQLDYDEIVAVDKSGVFALGDIAYYPTDDLRLSVGAASVLGYESVNLGAEYQVAGFELPFSLTADARFGEDGDIRATAGLKLYFGGGDKSLIDRHRQDDPRDRGLDLFAAAGNQIVERDPVASDFTDPGSCEAAGFTWVYSYPEHCA